MPFILNRNSNGGSLVSGVTLCCISSSWGVSFLLAAAVFAVWHNLAWLLLTKEKASLFIYFDELLIFERKAGSGVDTDA
jgi:hypothetical protein